MRSRPGWTRSSTATSKRKSASPMTPRSSRRLRAVESSCVRLLSAEGLCRPKRSKRSSLRIRSLDGCGHECQRFGGTFARCSTPVSSSSAATTPVADTAQQLRGVPARRRCDGRFRPVPVGRKISKPGVSYILQGARRKINQIEDVPPVERKVHDLPVLDHAFPGRAVSLRAKTAIPQPPMTPPMCIGNLDGCWSGAGPPTLP